MRKLLGLLSSVSLVAHPAFATDLAPPVYKARPIAAPFNWTGCYAGATAGVVEGKSNVSWAADPAGFPTGIPSTDPPPASTPWGKGDKDKYGKGDKDDRYGKGDKDDHYSKGDKDDHYSKGGKDDRYGKGDKDDRYGKGDKDDRYGKGDKDDRYGKGDKDDRYGKGDKDDRYGKGDKDDRYGKDGKDDRHGKDGKDDRYAKGGNNNNSNGNGSPGGPGGNNNSNGNGSPGGPGGNNNSNGNGSPGGPGGSKWSGGNWSGSGDNYSGSGGSDYGKGDKGDKDDRYGKGDRGHRYSKGDGDNKYGKGDKDDKSGNNNPDPPPPPTLTQGFAVGTGDAISAQTGNSLSSTGFTGGVELGCNWQANPWLVLGIEGDWQYTGLDGSASGVVSVGGTANPYTESFNSRWLSTIRGRVGVANGQWLFFATGGFAFADASFSDFIAFSNGTFNAASSSGIMTGWTVGGGAEWFFMPHWSAKAEYLHVDLGTKNFTSANSNPAEYPLAIISHSHSLVEEIGRIGVNYHF